MKIILTIGLPASGKSTWAKEYVKENKTYVRVSRDDLRNMRGIYWVPDQEDLITDWERSCIDSSLNRGYNVVIDATNLNMKFRNALINTYSGENDIELKYFKTPLKDCLKRDKGREGEVGEEVIMRMYKNALKEGMYQE